MKIKTKEALGQNIKKARKNKNLTQAQLAELIDRTESSVRKYEKGLIDVPNEVITKIAKVLEVLPADLLPFDEWDEEFNVEQISEEVKIIEAVQKIFGKETVDLIEHYMKLNDAGKQKILNLIEDLTQIPKYTKK